MAAAPSLPQARSGIEPRPSCQGPDRTRAADAACTSDRQVGGDPAPFIEARQKSYTFSLQQAQRRRNFEADFCAPFEDARRPKSALAPTLAGPELSGDSDLGR